MNEQQLKDIWLKHYSASEAQLEKMSEVKGLISAFNANIDAVIKLSGEKIQSFINDPSLNQALFNTS